MTDRLHVSQRTGTDLKRRRSLPVAPFHRVACRRSGHCIWPCDESLGESGDRGHLVDNGPGFLVLSELQIGINEVVHRMQLVVEVLGLLCDPSRFHVRRDRFFPITDARENV